MGKSSNKKKLAWFKQCTFTSKTETGEMIHTAWIPENFAVVGRVLYFGKKTKNPDRLWTVDSIGGRKSGDYVAKHERDHLTQRAASDI